MATKDTAEKKSITGLDQASDRKEAEYDLVTALLSAAEYKTDDDNITEAEIVRNKKHLFSVHIDPIADEDSRFARKKATVMMPNPENRKLPPIEKEFNYAKFKSWMIYLATTEEDQKKIWGNSQVMAKYDLKEPWETVGILLTGGEKNRLYNLITKISGFDDEEFGDEETFQQSAD